VSFGDEHTCHIEGICTVHSKMFNGTIRELQYIGYVSQLMKNLISVGVMEVQGLKETLGEGVIMIFSGSLVVLKSIRHNNLYYLNSSAVTENLTASERVVWMAILTGYGR